MFKVFMISGSMDYPSHTLAVIEEAAIQLKQHDCEAAIWDLSIRPLPFCNPAYHHHPDEHPDQEVKAFVKLALEADGFILGSPNYHNSYSGVLKNALDLLNMNLFRHKPVGLVCNGGGIRNVQPLDHLRIVVRGLYGVAIPMQVATQNEDFIQAVDRYQLTDKAMKERIHHFVNQLVMFMNKLKGEY